jgi:uncharacterized protein YbjQ (UPF0145 family)
VLSPAFVTTAFELPGFRVARSLGVVRGVTVRSRSVVGTIGASLQTLFGGNVTCGAGRWLRQRRREISTTRADGSPRLENSRPPVAKRLPAAESHDANEVAQGVTEVLAYGTAVVVEQAR